MAFRSLIGQCLVIGELPVFVESNLKARLRRQNQYGNHVTPLQLRAEIVKL